MSCCEVSVYSLAAEELSPLFQLEGFLSMAVPKPVCILCFSITKFCSRPHQTPGKGLRSKGSRKDWNSSPHTSLLLWISPAPHSQVTGALLWERCNHLNLVSAPISWSIPLQYYTSMNTAFNALFSLIPMRDLICLHPEIIWHIITSYHKLQFLCLSWEVYFILAFSPGQIFKND